MAAATPRKMKDRFNFMILYISDDGSCRKGVKRLCNETKKIYYFDPRSRGKMRSYTRSLRKNFLVYLPILIRFIRRDPGALGKI